MENRFFEIEEDEVGEKFAFYVSNETLQAWTLDEACKFCYENSVSGRLYRFNNECFYGEWKLAYRIDSAGIAIAIAN